jgi:hypothetical protein
MTGWVDVEDEELLAAISATQRECNAAEARMLLVIAELDHRGLAAERGYKDTVDLLQTMQRVSVGTAKDRVRVARKTTPERTLQGEELSAAMPATGAALGAAEISFEHARVIERTLAALPAHLVADHAEALERDLAEHARVLDPNALRKLGKHALVLLDPDGARPRDGAPVRNRLRFTPRGAGFELRGWFDQECTAILRTAISPWPRLPTLIRPPLIRPARMRPGRVKSAAATTRPQNLRPQNLSPIGGPRRSGTGTRSSSWPGG